MKGDFSRDSFDPMKHFTRVLMQQGRVHLDSDWNDQVSMIFHYLRALAADIIGPHGGPQGNGFLIIDKNSTSSIDDLPGLPKLEEISTMRFNALAEEEAAAVNPNGGVLDMNAQKIPPGDFIIGKGRYYVDGILCENDNYVFYSQQPDWRPGRLPDASRKYLVYLEVQERHITHMEDSSIREVALGGADTATRARVVWQVKTEEMAPPNTDNCNTINEKWADMVKKWQAENRGRLRAKAKEIEEDEYADPCIISPGSRYRGAENQLYRVEIHRGSDSKEGPPTFKWSRDNGSVLFAISDSKGDAKTATVTLRDFGRDDRFTLAPGNWVEVVYKQYELKGEPQPLLKVTAVDPINKQVTLAGTITTENRPQRDRILRRWEGNGAEKIQADGATWVKLEDGIQIQFQADTAKYRTGDYWLIPARTASGDIIWPNEKGQPVALPPRGVEHHFAPLGIITVNAGEVAVSDTCRKFIKPVTQ